MSDRRDVTTSSRSASQEGSMSREEGHEIRVGLQHLSDMIMNVSHRLEKMKEMRASRPAKRANLTQLDDGRGDVAPPEGHESSLLPTITPGGIKGECFQDSSTPAPGLWE